MLDQIKIKSGLAALVKEELTVRQVRLLQHADKWKDTQPEDDRDVLSGCAVIAVGVDAWEGLPEELTWGPLEVWPRDLEARVDVVERILSFSHMMPLINEITTRGKLSGDVEKKSEPPSEAEGK